MCGRCKILTYDGIPRHTDNPMSGDSCFLPLLLASERNAAITVHIYLRLSINSGPAMQGRDIGIRSE